MNKYYYIKKSAGNHVLCYKEALDSEVFIIGETWQDYLNDKYILLGEEQIAFYTVHPNASINEIFNAGINTDNTNAVERARINKKLQIELYNTSSNVNDFIVNGTIHSWLKPNERANYRNSIDSAKLLGIDNVRLFIGNMPITLSTNDAERMLAQIQLYADECYLVTKNHILSVEALNDVESIENYDHTTGYPEKLMFTV